MGHRRPGPMVLQEQGAALRADGPPGIPPAPAPGGESPGSRGRTGGPVVGWLVSDLCASWPTQRRPVHRPWNVITGNPILFIGTRFDPTRPLRKARLAARRLGQRGPADSRRLWSPRPPGSSTCVDARSRLGQLGPERHGRILGGSLSRRLIRRWTLAKVPQVDRVQLGPRRRKPAKAPKR